MIFRTIHVAVNGIISSLLCWAYRLYLNINTCNPSSWFPQITSFSRTPPSLCRCSSETDVVLSALPSPQGLPALSLCCSPCGFWPAGCCHLNPRSKAGRNSLPCSRATMGEGGKDGTELRFSRPTLTPPKLAGELKLSGFCQHFTPGRERFGSSSNFLGEWPGGCRHHQGSLDLCTDLCQQSCWVFSILFCILFFFPSPKYSLFCNF